MYPDRDTELTDDEIDQLRMDEICARCKQRRGTHWEGGWCGLFHPDNEALILAPYRNLKPTASKLENISPGKFTFQKRVWTSETNNDDFICLD